MLHKLRQSLLPLAFNWVCHPTALWICEKELIYFQSVCWCHQSMFHKEYIVAYVRKCLLCHYLMFLICPKICISPVQNRLIDLLETTLNCPTNHVCKQNKQVVNPFSKRQTILHLYELLNELTHIDLWRSFKPRTETSAMKWNYLRLLHQTLTPKYRNPKCLLRGISWSLELSRNLLYLENSLAILHYHRNLSESCHVSIAWKSFPFISHSFSIHWLIFYFL